MISIIILITIGSNGRVVFTGVPPGRYRLRVVASAPGHNQSVIRRRVVIPEDPNYCTVNLIDEGTIINGSDVTVLFRGVGPVREFLCLMDRQIQVLCEFVASKIKINSYGDCCPLYAKSLHIIFHRCTTVYCIPQIDC